MKKSLRSLLAFLIAATVLCCIAMADTGPKPSASFTLSLIHISEPTRH